MLVQGGCFSFKFRAERLVSRQNIGRLFVFVVDGNNSTLPVWSGNLDSYDGWFKAEIKLNFSSGFNQVSRIFLRDSIINNIYYNVREIGDEMSKHCW